MYNSFNTLLVLFFNPLKQMNNMEKVIINVEQGTLKGKTGIDYNGKKYYAFQGIPYAKPPVGELRFKAPQPLEKWTGIKDATQDGSQCYSRDMTTGIGGSEDCLFLNVFTPELPAKNTKSRPVMVWIHGGAFINGSNSTQIYGPDFILTGDVVLVSINYRTGVLGFLAMNDSELEVPGNAGMKDMVLALKWVQNNIKDFGGDPNNVTIFGASAGGAAVHLLVLSPMAKGLFHKAIAQSGSALNPWVVCVSCYKELAEALECPYTEEKKILRFLQELPVEKLYEGQVKIGDNFSANYVRSLGPTIEKSSPFEQAFLEEHPMELILKGKYNKVPLMMGYTSAEGLLFDIPDFRDNQSEPQINLENYVPNVFGVKVGSDLSKSIAEKLQKFYLGDEMPSPENREKLCALQTDSFFFRGIYSSIRNHAKISEGLFLYRFSVDAGLSIVKVAFKINTPGACHGDDVGYLFKVMFHPEIQSDSIEDNTVRRMVKLWTNFARTGDPNPIENVVWRPVLKDEINYLDIGEKLVSAVNPEEERMKLWDDILSTPTTAGF